MVYRIDPELAREQAQWFVIGLLFFCATIVFLRDHHALERYRYPLAAAGTARAGWCVRRLPCGRAPIVFLPAPHVLERYRYTIAAAGIALLVMPRLPGIGA